MNIVRAIDTRNYVDKELVAFTYKSTGTTDLTIVDNETGERVNVELDFAGRAVLIAELQAAQERFPQ